MSTLLREPLQESSIAQEMAYCLADTRNPEYVEFSVDELIDRRLLGFIPCCENQWLLLWGVRTFLGMIAVSRLTMGSPLMGKALSIESSSLRIVIRAHSGFCCGALRSYCQNAGVEYLVGIATNAQPQALVKDNMEWVRAESKLGELHPPRTFSTRPKTPGHPSAK